MSLTAVGTAPAANRGGKDIGFAVGIVLILCLFFLPVPAVMIDFGLALSIALSVLILMVGLWIQKPLEFSAFPTAAPRSASAAAALFGSSMDEEAHRCVDPTRKAAGPDARSRPLAPLGNRAGADMPQ